MTQRLETHECTQCLTLRVHGLDCAEEVSLLRTALDQYIEHEDEISFDLMRGTMTVHRPPTARDDAAIVGAVGRTGMKAETYAPESAEASTVQASRWADPRISRLTLLSGLALAGGYGMHAVLAGPMAAFTGEGEPPLAASIFWMVAAGLALVHTLPKARTSVRFLKPDMHLLMTIAILGAALLGEFAECATVAFLFLLSLLMESWNLERARRSVSALMAITPETARVKCPHDGDLSEKPVGSVNPGAIVVVRPGERIPMDGTVATGESLVDQSPITGESVPVACGLGDAVLAGTINQTGLIEVRVEKRAQDSTISRMLRMIEEARARRAPAEKWVDQFARYYTPLVMAAALLVMVTPPLALGEAWADWFYRGLVVLVIACPCALVISIPVAITAALSSAARQGVLIKGGLFLEQMAGLKGLAFDKTGTITAGKPEVVSCRVTGEATEQELLTVAASLESGAGHPIAEAILKYAAERGIAHATVSSHQARHGLGVTASVDGRQAWAGNAAFARAQSPALALPEASAGETVVYVGVDLHLLGYLGLRDNLRPEAKSVLEAIRRSGGIEEIRLLTGDTAEAAAPIAASAGIEQVDAGLRPDDKVARVHDMVRRLECVAMVGDGVNDAPALAAATVGVAMGAGGSDAALETADIALMNDDLTRLPWLLQHARATRRIVAQNIAFALGTKLLFVVLAALGWAGLWAAIAADTGASLLVTMNALWLLHAGKHKTD